MLTAEVTINAMDAVTGGRSILPEDAEGWDLGPGTGTGPRAVKENTVMSLCGTKYPPPITDSTTV